MNLEFVRVDPATVAVMESITIDIPAVAYVAAENGRVIGSYGLAWGGGRCWAWLRLPNGKPRHALAVARRTKLLLSKAVQLGETQVFTPRDAEYASSEKLLTLLGFRMHCIEDGLEVWKWEL